MKRLAAAALLAVCAISTAGAQVRAALSGDHDSA